MQVVLQDRLTVADGRYLLDAQPFTGCRVTLETDVPPKTVTAMDAVIPCYGVREMARIDNGDIVTAHDPDALNEVVGDVGLVTLEAVPDYFFEAISIDLDGAPFDGKLTQFFRGHRSESYVVEKGEGRGGLSLG